MAAHCSAGLSRIVSSVALGRGWLVGGRHWLEVVIIVVVVDVFEVVVCVC
jgi:hypothetical protein